MPKRKPQYYKKTELPIRIIQRKNKKGLKTAGSLFLVFALIASQAMLFAAYEAYVINVTAHICGYSETRTMGYWKNHSGIYYHYLPQYLGREICENPDGTDFVETIDDANKVFKDANADNMADMLKAQLLAMKFNIAHFGIAGYKVEKYGVEEYEGKTISEIVEEADDLLCEGGSRYELEELKNVLDYLNNLHRLGYCSEGDNVAMELQWQQQSSSEIVLNEILPNPSGLVPDYGFNFGEDDDLQPQGEWVELYNKGASEIDLSGWYILTKKGNYAVSITPSNTHTGSTVIGPNGSGQEWLVVYMNHALLNNHGKPADTVYLYNSDDVEIDSYSYYGEYCSLEPTSGKANKKNPEGSCKEVEGNKSFARIPDGTDNWLDPIPTPGGPNKEKLEEEPMEGLTEESMEEPNQTTDSEEISEPVFEPISEQENQTAELPDIEPVETATPSEEGVEEPGSASEEASAGEPEPEPEPETIIEPEEIVFDEPPEPATLIDDDSSPDDNSSDETN